MDRRPETGLAQACPAERSGIRQQTHLAPEIPSVPAPFVEQSVPLILFRRLWAQLLKEPQHGRHAQRDDLGPRQQSSRH
jgi:hypothetical protein